MSRLNYSLVNSYTSVKSVTHIQWTLHSVIGEVRGRLAKGSGASLEPPTAEASMYRQHSLQAEGYRSPGRGSWWGHGTVGRRT